MGDEVSFCKRRNDIRESRGGPKAGGKKEGEERRAFCHRGEKKDRVRKVGDLKEVEMGKGLEETEERKEKCKGVKERKGNKGEVRDGKKMRYRK